MSFDFSVDWVSDRIPLWQRTLTQLEGLDNVQALEIGCFEGRATVWFLENVLKGSGSKITVIDPFGLLAPMYGVKEGEPNPLDETERRFDRNIEAINAGQKTVKIKGFSQVELRKLPLESFDFIYVDGWHAAKDVLEDAVLSWRLLKIGGVMIFDDYLWRQDDEGIRNEYGRPGVGVDAFLGVFAPYLTVLERSWQLIVRKEREQLSREELFASKFPGYEISSKK